MNQAKPPGFVEISADELFKLCKDKSTYIGKEMWKFYSSLRSSFESDNPSVLMHNSAFSDELKSGFQIHGLKRVPEDEMRRLTSSLPDDVDLSAEKTKSKDGNWVVAFVFSKVKPRQRDKSPNRPQKVDLKRKSKSKKPSIGSSGSDSEDRKRKAEKSDDEEESPRTQFRRSQTPSKSIPRAQSRDRSISRESVLRLKPSEVAKLKEELVKKDATLVEVAPLDVKNPTRKKLFGFL